MVAEMYNRFCGVHGCNNYAEEIHHRLNNSKVHVRNFPLFINSPINLIPLCRKHHEDGKVLKELKWNERQAGLWEEYLTVLKKGDK